MAKETFQRSKPHVNVGSISGLQRLGFSAVGAHQVVSGLLVTDSKDRELAAQILQQLGEQAVNTPVKQDIEFIFKKIEVGR